jgi:hypothetical protein
MTRLARVSLVLALLTAGMAGAADTAQTANSNEVESPIPQLSVNPNAGPEVPMARETNPPAAPDATATPAVTRPRSPWRVIPAVLAVVAGSYLLQRRRARSRPS